MAVAIRTASRRMKRLVRSFNCFAFWRVSDDWLANGAMSRSCRDIRLVERDTDPLFLPPNDVARHMPSLGIKY
jgi:hypothetical protein